MKRVIYFFKSSRHVVYALVACSIAAVCIGAFVYTRESITTAPSLADFIRLSDRTFGEEQERVAERYLKFYSPVELEEALQEAFPLARCHRQAHGLGSAVYKQTNSLTETLAICGSQCNQGCFHGGLMQMFSTDSDTLGGVIEDETPDAYIGKVLQLAATLCDQPDVKSVVNPRFCYHGIGHVFALTSGYDAHKAAHMCDIYDNTFAKDGCTSGMFMEYATNQALALELSTSTPALCDSFNSRERPFCYRYLARYWVQQAGGARSTISICAELPADRAAQCMYGVTFAETEAGDGNSANTVISQLCSHVDDRYRESCVTGAIHKVSTNVSDGSTLVCEALLPAYRPTCESLVHYNKNGPAR